MQGLTLQAKSIGLVEVRVRQQTIRPSPLHMESPEARQPKPHKNPVTFIGGWVFAA